MGICPNMWRRVWHHTDHAAIQVVPARVSAAVSGNFVIMHFRFAASKARHFIFRCYIIDECHDIICDITAPHVPQSCDILLQKVCRCLTQGSWPLVCPFVRFAFVTTYLRVAGA